eukprot:SAG11_NODE_30687_length_298_cov_1.512563_1_plen_34_part_01
MYAGTYYPVIMLVAIWLGTKTKHMQEETTRLHLV